MKRLFRILSFIFKNYRNDSFSLLLLSFPILYLYYQLYFIYNHFQFSIDYFFFTYMINWPFYEESLFIIKYKLKKRKKQVEKVS